MDYLYGEFNDNQTAHRAKAMHSEIHRLLLFKDKKVNDVLFQSEEEFHKYFVDLLYRFGGLNHLLNYPDYFIDLMTALQLALDESEKAEFDFAKFRKLILDAHSYISVIFDEEV